MERSPGQPFTFAGVARYASARMGRLLGVAFLFAALAATVVGRFAAHCWWPVISEAVANLPETGAIQRGALQLADKDARLLAGNQFLALELTLGELTSENAPVDLSIDLGRYEVITRSVLGENAFPYPDTWVVPLSRSVLWPLWGAWKGPLLFLFALSALAGLIVTWFVLGLFYAPILLTLAGMGGRPLRFAGAWKIAVAAQWPASLLMTFAIALYSTGEVGLLFVLIMFVAHFIPTLFNVLIAPFFLPKKNQVETEPDRGNEPSRKPRAKKGRGKNPFRSDKTSGGRKRNPFSTAAEVDES